MGRSEPPSRRSDGTDCCAPPWSPLSSYVFCPHWTSLAATACSAGSVGGPLHVPAAAPGSFWPVYDCSAFRRAPGCRLLSPRLPLEPRAAAAFLLLPLSFQTGPGYVDQASTIHCLPVSVFPSVKITGVRLNFLQVPALPSFAKTLEPKLAQALF